MTGTTGPGTGPLARMVATTPTDFWNDSCALEELEWAVERGGTGATSNPVIVGEVMGKERAHWAPRVLELAAANPTWTEVELTWAVIEEMGIRGAAVLAPVFAREDGRKGRLSLQTTPRTTATRSGWPTRPCTSRRSPRTSR